MKFPNPRFWWWSKAAFWSVDLLFFFAITLAFIAIELRQGPLELPGMFLFRLILPLAAIIAYMHTPPSHWIFRRWFRVIEASRKRRRLAEWNELNEGHLSRAIRKEPWFQKPS